MLFESLPTGPDPTAAGHPGADETLAGIGGIDSLGMIRREQGEG